MTELVTLAANAPMPVAVSAGNNRRDPPPAIELTTPQPNAASATTTRSTDMAAQARHVPGDTSDHCPRPKECEPIAV